MASPSSSRPQESNSLGYSRQSQQFAFFIGANCNKKNWINIMADHSRDYCHAEPQSGRGNRNYRVATMYEIRDTFNVVGVFPPISAAIAACSMENYLFSLSFFIYCGHFTVMHEAWTMHTRRVRSSTRCAHSKWANVYMLLKLLNNKWWREMKKKILQKQKKNCLRALDECTDIFNGLYSICSLYECSYFIAPCSVFRLLWLYDILRG